MIAADSTTIFVATKEQEIVGLLTLVVFRIPTGVRAWIEDVVVDESARGHGVGEALNRAALDDARRRGAKTVDLTSRPSRAARLSASTARLRSARDERLPLRAVSAG